METDKLRRSAPWVEKYRPEKVDDVAHQEEVVRTLKTSIAQGSLPHLLFHGSPGTGKTTTILAVARALYGPELYRARILELNASDERGIAVVREKIKTFAQGAVGDQKVSGYPCPKFKLIILDEADTMTPEAQSALRRTMETYSRVTRFCLICNYVTRIIEPLSSRCAKFRFKPLPMESMIARLLFIAEIEKVKLADGALEEIMSSSGGDMRKAVTDLQSSSQLGSIVTPHLLTEITGKVPRETVNGLWQIMTGSNFDSLKAAVTDIIFEGYPLATILSQIHQDLLDNPGILDVQKALIAEKLAEVEQCLLDGSSETLQLLDLCAFIMRTLGRSDFSVENVSASAH